jgi:hypothetical protein
VSLHYPSNPRPLASLLLLLLLLLLLSTITSASSILDRSAALTL